MDKVKNSNNAIKDLYNQAQAIKGLDRRAADYSKKYEEKIKDIQENFEKAQMYVAERESDMFKQRQTVQYNNIANMAQRTLNNNPNIAQNADLMRQYQDIIKKAEFQTEDLQKLKVDLSAANDEMVRLGLNAETAGQKLVRLFKEHFSTAVVMAGLHALQEGLQQVVINVSEVDRAMTDLRKVSEGTTADYDNYLANTAKSAKDLGATMTDVIDATAEFSRLGYDLADSAALGEAAVMYKNVSEYENIDDAAQSIVSTMKAFGIAADDVGSVIDKFNEINTCLPAWRRAA